MRTLFVFNHPAPYKVKLFNELAKTNEIDVIFEREKSKNRNLTFYEGNIYNFNAIFLNCFPIGNENSFSNKLKTYIKKNYKNYDKIVMNGYSSFTELKAIRYMNKHNIPFTLMINGGIIHKESRLKKYIKTKFISSAQEYFSPNVSSNKYLEYYGADSKLIKLYPYSNIFEHDILLELPNTLDIVEKRVHMNLPKDKLFISVGQFIKRKNNEELIHLFENSDFNLYLVGSGKNKKKYKKYLVKNNIKNITLSDDIENSKLLKMLPYFDGLITLSKEDIFGHTIIEALAKSLPVITSPYVLSSEVIKDNINGYIVPLGNKEKQLEALNKSLNLDRRNISSTIKANTIENEAKTISRYLQ